MLDADIRAFFDTLDHGWLVKFVEHRVADRRILRLIQKWLNAGVLEDGQRAALKTTGRESLWPSQACSFPVTRRTASTNAAHFSRCRASTRRPSAVTL